MTACSGIVVHATHDAQVLDNVAYNVAGHCYYLEDGVEERNVFEHNLAAFIHPIGPTARGATVVRRKGD